MCLKRAVNTVDVELDQDSSEEQILNIKVWFRIDMGAKCNTLSLDRYQVLMSNSIPSVANPLQVKVIEKLREMVEDGHISDVDQPTE